VQTQELHPTSKNPPIPIQQTLVLLLACLALATLANWLFRANLLGLNVSLWVSSFALVMVFYSRHLRHDSLSLFLLGAWVVLSWLFLLRASPFLQALNIAVQLFLLMLLVARSSTRALTQSNFAEIAINGVLAGFSLLFRPFVFLFESNWSALSFYKERQNTRTLFAIFRGLIIALPLLLVFGFLLASADAVFENLLSTLFRFDLGSSINHLITILLLSFVMLALLAQAFFGPLWKSFQIQAPPVVVLGRIETTIVFGLLILLFVGFMIIQFGYLFGGEARVLGSDITFAQYGRRGFFELVMVTFLLHIVLLLGLWLITEVKARSVYKMLATVLVILLYGIIWSAQDRLGLYIRTYGLTELRYYSSAMIYWIGLVMLYFLFYLFSPKAPKLAPSYILLGIVGVVGLYISNPDARIATVNLEQAKQLSQIDIEYLEHLSLDALPVIAAFYQTHPEWDLDPVLSLKYFTLPDSDWRQFNWGRWRGSEVLKAIYQVSL
jgi:Domain of unknown function (DUF4173)